MTALSHPFSYWSEPGRNSPALHSFGSHGITLYFQDGPIGEFGKNGTTNEEVIYILIDRIESLNTMYEGKYSCAENFAAITYLRAAVASLEQRTASREARGVEGTSKA